MNDMERVKNGIAIYRHTFEDKEWFTDSPDPYDRSAREYAPFVTEEGSWHPIEGGHYVLSESYEYWPSYGTLVQVDR